MNFLADQFVNLISSFEDEPYIYIKILSVMLVG